MKGKNLIFTGVIVFLVGLLLLIFRRPLANGGIVYAAGIIFVGAGILNITVFLGSRDKDGRSRMGAFGTAFGWIVSAAAVILGLAMIIFKGAFVALIGFMYGVLILFAALFMLFMLIFGSRPTRLSNWFFLVPTALVGASIYIFMRKPDVPGETIDILVTAISFMLFGLFTVIAGSVVGNNNRSIRKAAEAAAKEESLRISEGKSKDAGVSAVAKTAGEKDGSTRAGQG